MATKCPGLLLTLPKEVALKLGLEEKYRVSPELPAGSPQQLLMFKMEKLRHRSPDSLKIQLSREMAASHRDSWA